ncbi:hypothetical protein K7X08_000994 [Anisodus acutangulus]|uniref:Uncharacterized protein n=1 Tax=Anisodus acutangulus TaxID=402998 RepID=A0A9Q1MTI8_9SOLA|nr:hypothetical protein K7X08_000994 [Anisodus acutangulus]
MYQLSPPLKVHGGEAWPKATGQSLPPPPPLLPAAAAAGWLAWWQVAQEAGPTTTAVESGLRFCVPPQRVGADALAAAAAPVVPRRSLPVPASPAWPPLLGPFRAPALLLRRRHDSAIARWPPPGWTSPLPGCRWPGVVIPPTLRPLIVFLLFSPLTDDNTAPRAYQRNAKSPKKKKKAVAEVVGAEVATTKTRAAKGLTQPKKQLCRQNRIKESPQLGHNQRRRRIAKKKESQQRRLHAGPSLAAVVDRPLGPGLTHQAAKQPKKKTSLPRPLGLCLHHREPSTARRQLVHGHRSHISPHPVVR